MWPLGTNAGEATGWKIREKLIGRPPWQSGPCFLRCAKTHRITSLNLAGDDHTALVSPSTPIGEFCLQRGEVLEYPVVSSFPFYCADT